MRPILWMLGGATVAPLAAGYLVRRASLEHYQPSLKQLYDEQEDRRTGKSLAKSLALLGLCGLISMGLCSVFNPVMDNVAVNVAGQANVTNGTEPLQRDAGRDGLLGMMFYVCLLFGMTMAEHSYKDKLLDVQTRISKGHRPSLLKS